MLRANESRRATDIDQWIEPPGRSGDPVEKLLVVDDFAAHFQDRVERGLRCGDQRRSTAILGYACGWISGDSQAMADPLSVWQAIAKSPSHRTDGIAEWLQVVLTIVSIQKQLHLAEHSRCAPSCRYLDRSMTSAVWARPWLSRPIRYMNEWAGPRRPGGDLGCEARRYRVPAEFAPCAIGRDDAFDGAEIYQIAEFDAGLLHRP